MAQKRDSLPKLPKEDSIQLKKSQDFYKTIQEKSKNSKFTKVLHELMFEPVDPSREKKSRKKIENQLNRDLSTYQGKIIRRIKITSYDPFGYSEKDTTVKPKRKIDNFGNALHAKTKSFTIQGLLLLKKNTPLDTLLILESERLLRKRKFIRRALIRPEEISKTSDSIDLHVYVLDSWSLGIDGDISSSKGELRLSEYNFFGLGHQYSTAYKKGFEGEDNVGFTLGYKAQNLYNTYINAEISRDVEIDQSYRNIARINRTFYSPYTRWAGELSVQQHYYFEDFFNKVSDTIIKKPLKTKGYNVWGGFAIPIKTNTKEHKLPTNVIIAARYATRDFLEKPNEKIDSVAYFSNENIKLASIGVQQVDYIRDRYIFRNGDIEDVGVGHSYFIHTGVQTHGGKNNLYLGIDLTLTNYFSDFGYLAANLQYGSYFRNHTARQSLLKAQGTYFTPIFQVGNWYVRQFVKTNMIIGINRKEIIKDRIDLNGYYGLQNFDSNQVFGTRKFVFNFKTQSYVPFNWLGFRMSPFFDFDIGFIGTDPSPFLKNNTYTRLGIGFLISNDYFVFENIKLSFSFFPTIPGQGENISRFNGNYDDIFSLDEYEYQSPHILEYK